MSLSSKQQRDLEHYQELYDKAVEENDIDELNSILQTLRNMGFKDEARHLLGHTKLSKLVTPSCIDDWETRDATQEDL